MSAGELRERVAFDQRATVSDGYGNRQSTFVEQFSRPARIQPLRGGEQVQASRLTGTQPVIIRVRYDSQTKIIAPEWRARDTRSGLAYSIKSLMNTDEHKRYIDLLATGGEAA